MTKEARPANTASERGHIIAPDDGAPWYVCKHCGQPITEDVYGRGLVTMAAGNPECYGKEAAR